MKFISIYFFSIALILSVFFLASCNDDSITELQDESGYLNLKNLNKEELLTLLDFNRVRDFNPDAHILNRNNERLLVAPDGSTTSVPGDRSSIDLIAKSEHTSIEAQIGSISHKYMNSAENSQHRLILDSPDDDFMWGNNLTFDFGDGRSHQMYVPERMAFSSTSQYDYADVALGASRTSGIEFAWNPDPKNEGGVVIFVEYRESGLKPKRNIMVVEDDGSHHLTASQLDFIDKGGEFRISLLRGVYKTYTGGDNVKYLFLATSNISGDFVMLD